MPSADLDHIGKQSLNDTHRWCLSGEILSASRGDRTVVLNLKSGKYYALHGAASYKWRDLVAIGEGDREDPEQATATCLRPETRPADLDLPFIQDLERLGLIVEGRHPDLPGPRPTSSRPSAVFVGERRKAPSTFGCVLRLALVHASLRLFRLRQLLRWLERLPVAPWSGSEAERRWTLAAARSVVLAGTFYPIRARCLVRGLCIAWVCRRAGVDVRVKFGARLYPFGAHAWPVLGEEPLIDPPDQLQFYEELRPCRPTSRSGAHPRRLQGHAT